MLPKTFTHQAAPEQNWRIATNLHTLRFNELRETPQNPEPIYSACQQSASLPGKFIDILLLLLLLLKLLPYTIIIHDIAYLMGLQK